MNAGSLRQGPYLPRHSRDHGGRWFLGGFQVFHTFLGEDTPGAAWPGGTVPHEAPAAMTAAMTVAEMPLLLSLLFSLGPHALLWAGLHAPRGCFHFILFHPSRAAPKKRAKQRERLTAMAAKRGPPCFLRGRTVGVCRAGWMLLPLKRDTWGGWQCHSLSERFNVEDGRGIAQLKWTPGCGLSTEETRKTSEYI